MNAEFKVKAAYAVSLLSLFALLAVIVVWNGWLAPQQSVPRSLEIAVLAVPALFFLRGMLHGNRQSYVMIMMLAFVYFMTGFWNIVEASERNYALLLIAFSTSLFFGAYFYARWIVPSEPDEEVEKSQQ